VAAPKPARAKPAKPKKAAAPKRPKTQKYDWDKVRAAADAPSDPNDINWIRKLDHQIRVSIDGMRDVETPEHERLGPGALSTGDRQITS
jgi:hypothetical protein